MLNLTSLPGSSLEVEVCFWRQNIIGDKGYKIINAL